MFRHDTCLENEVFKVQNRCGNMNIGLLYGPSMLFRWKPTGKPNPSGFLPIIWGTPPLLVGFHLFRGELTTVGFHPDNIDGPCGMCMNIRLNE